MTEFQPVDCGDMSEIPPDAPAGKWKATCKVARKTATQKDGCPMLVLEWHLDEADEDENKSSEGARATDFVTFFPAKHNGARMSRVRLKQMCDALKIDLPQVQRIESWNDLREFTDALDGLQAEIWTTVEVRKDTGEKTTKVHYVQPGRKLNLSAPVDEDDAPKGKKGKK